MKSQSSILKIFIIIFLAILVDQGMETVLLESIASIDPTGLISNTFLLLSIPFAMFLASLSDFHCRRKTLIFALTSLLISGVFILFFNKYGSDWTAYTALVCKGVGGNVTPIAMASLATIIPPKKFTCYLAVAICAYAFGSWVPIRYRSSEYLPFIFITLSFCCYLITIKWFRETKFDNFRLKNQTLNLSQFLQFTYKDWKLIALFCILPSVILVYLGFIFSEISFYQILLRGEVLIQNKFYSELSLKMGLGYYIGTGFLWFLKNKNITDRQSLVLGVIIAIFSTISSSILNYTLVENRLIYNFFIMSFSFGFSLLTPSLFAMLSKLKKTTEQGKIYGLLDSTDTLAELIASSYIKHSKSVTYNQVLWVSSTILLISGILIVNFIRYVKRGGTK